MGKVGNWIISILGYGAYTLAVVVVLLWFLFPTDSCRVWLQSQFAKQNSSLVWDVKEVKLAWPLSLDAIQLQAREPEAASPLLAIDSIKFRPAVKNILGFSDTVSLVYSLRGLDGTVDGNIAIGKESGMINCTGDINKLKLEKLEGIWKKIGRGVNSEAGGTFTYQGKWQDLLSGDLQAKVRLENGSVELLKPVMGMNSLDFRQMDTSISLKQRTMSLEDSTMESDLFAAEFSGTLEMTEDIFNSVLDIKGWFEPRPELLANLKDQRVVKVVKSQLRDNKLNFKLTDTLMSPGIAFEGTSGIIDGVLQGGGR